MLNVKVESVSKKTSNGNFIHKVVSSKSVIVLGIEKVAKVTYYVALTSAAKVGSTHELDLSMFTIMERPYELPDTKEVIMLKWLHLK